MVISLLEYEIKNNAGFSIQLNKDFLVQRVARNGRR